jgi:uncharacterized low-complexity protein
MNQLMISVVVAVILTAAAAAVLRSHGPSTAHTGVTKKAPDSCRRQKAADPGYEGMSLIYSSKDRSAQ